jgi:hypothetical protein
MKAHNVPLVNQGVFYCYLYHLTPKSPKGDLS